MVTRVIKRLKPLFIHEKSSQKLAISFSVGAFIAFSPFIACHTLMVVIFSWVFKLHWPIMIASSNLINNPWTMVPVYSAGYFLGDFILHDLCGINGHALNPSWMSWINEPLGHYLGMPAISLWSFMLGGNLLGIMVAVILYPVMKSAFDRFLATDQVPSYVEPEINF